MYCVAAYCAIVLLPLDRGAHNGLFSILSKNYKAFFHKSIDGTKIDGYQCFSPLMNSVNSRKEKKFGTNSKDSHFIPGLGSIITVENYGDLLILGRH